MEKSKIIFVYNAHSGAGHKTLDFLHKIVSPATYQCSLCALTYGNFRMKNEWKQFVKKLPHRVEFWYKNDFLKIYPPEHTFPCVYLFTSHSRQLLLSAEEMERISLDEMKEILQKRLLSQ